MNLITDKAGCNITLRNACFIIGGSFLTVMVVGFFANIKMYADPTVLVGFMVGVLFNLALLFGALWRNEWLVLSWLLYPVHYLLGCVFLLFCYVFNYREYREAMHGKNVFAGILVPIVMLFVFLYCVRLVLSFFMQLRKPKSDVPVAAVV